MKEPLLPLVEPFLDDRPLIAAEDAVVQFENLLSTLSGPREKERWKALRSRLIVYKMVGCLYQAPHHMPISMA